MDARRLPRFRKGDALTAQTLNDLVDALRRQRLMKGRGITLQETPDGTVVGAASSPSRGSLAQTSGVISARSGSTAGTGTVKLATVDTNSAAITVGSQTQAVFNFSQTPSTGIPSGKYCWIAQDDSGAWWIVSAEC